MHSRLYTSFVACNRICLKLSVHFIKNTFVGI